MKNLFKNPATSVVFIFLFFLLGACKKNSVGTPPVTPDPPLPVTTSVAISVDKAVKYQTIQGFGFFGGHDVWWANSSDVWNQAWGEKVITDLGITMWRTEIFPPSTPTDAQDADWAKQKPVVEGLKAIATSNNVTLKFLATVWSPPADLKWTASMSWAGDVTVSFPASNGYVAYKYKNDVLAKQLRLQITGSGSQLKAHVLLPAGIVSVVSVIANGKPVNFKIATVEQSKYVDVDLTLPVLQDVIIQY